MDSRLRPDLAGTSRVKRGSNGSPDGRSIGFNTFDQLKKVSVSGGAPVTLADLSGTAGGPSWGADEMILYRQREGIMQVSSVGGTPQLLIPFDDIEFIHGPQMLPGGEWVLFTVRGRGTTWDDAQIVAQSLTTDERVVLIDGRDGRYLPNDCGVATVTSAAMCHNGDDPSHLGRHW